jgi:hypothetical protein
LPRVLVVPLPVQPPCSLWSSGSTSACSASGTNVTGGPVREERWRKAGTGRSCLWCLGWVGRCSRRAGDPTPSCTSVESWRRGGGQEKGGR